MSQSAAATHAANPGHVSALMARHASLEAKLEAEARRPSPDAAEIAALKKAKLKIKDELRTG